MDIESYSEIKYDKFIFKIQNNIFYDSSHLWYHFANKKITIGLSDYLQQTIGDVSFVSLPIKGSKINPDDFSLEIETMKVNHEVSIPFAGIILDVNKELLDFPEVINEDPYDKGWLLVVEPEQSEIPRKTLMSSQDYFVFLQEELSKSE